jgi:hypothetical protein
LVLLTGRRSVDPGARLDQIETNRERKLVASCWSPRTVPPLIRPYAVSTSVAGSNSTIAGHKPASPVEAARHALALEHLDDLRRLDGQMRTSKARIADAVYRQLLIDAQTATGPGGQPGTALESSVADLTPQRPALRISHSRARTNARTHRAPSTTATSSRTRTPSTNQS